MSTDVATAAMNEVDAQRLTERIRLTAHNYAEARQKLQSLVAEAKAGNAHIALGYASWTSYLADVLGEEPMRLARDVRPEMVALMSGEEMPNTVIATILGVDESTVRNDLKRNSENSDLVAVRTVTKTNGKQHTVRPRSESKPADEKNPDLDIINDIRLYLRHLANSPKIAALPPAGKQHIINALTDTLNAIKEN